MQVFIANGRVASDIETKKTTNGKNSCQFDFVCNSSQLDEKNKLIPTFFKVQIYGKQVETIAKILSKGSPIIIEGEIIKRSYIDKQGNKKTFEYIAPSLYKGITLLENKSESQKRQDKQGRNNINLNQNQVPEDFFSPVDAESPF